MAAQFEPNLRNYKSSILFIFLVQKNSLAPWIYALSRSLFFNEGLTFYLIEIAASIGFLATGSPFWVSLYFFLIFKYSPSFRKIAKVALKNGWLLLLILGVDFLFVWFYTLVVFQNRQDELVSLESLSNQKGGSICESTAQCFLVIVERGITGSGLTELMIMTEWTQGNIGDWILKFLLTFSFFLLTNVLFFYLILSILIDTIISLRLTLHKKSSFFLFLINCLHRS
jgi:hypothetical protein